MGVKTSEQLVSLQNDALYNHGNVSQHYTVHFYGTRSVGKRTIVQKFVKYSTINCSFNELKIYLEYDIGYLGHATTVRYDSIFILVIKFATYMFFPSMLLPADNQLR